MLVNNLCNETLTIVLAGGKGSRLEPLTRDRAKPAVPFGGQYRIIDFSLSNCLNSGLRKILVLTQYKATSLDRHINLGWRKFFCDELGEFIDIMPPQQRLDEKWYSGTADAVYQNIYSLEKTKPNYVVILAGDHIYKMNYRSMVEYHVRVGADLTIGALTVPKNDARQFGVMSVDAHDRVIGFSEKPDEPETIPGNSELSLASMGIYVFSTQVLYDQLFEDANRRSSAHDFGANIIPSMIDSHQVFAYGFTDENRKSKAYWRDVGTIDAYYDANMDLVNVDPQLNLYDSLWPIRTHIPNLPPAKFVFGSSKDSNEQRRGLALDSIVCGGAIVSGAQANRCVIGPNSKINSYAEISNSILFDGVKVGRNARINRAVIDKYVEIPENAEFGFDADYDRQRGLSVSPNGVVVIGKGHNLKRIVTSPALS